MRARRYSCNVATMALAGGLRCTAQTLKWTLPITSDVSHTYENPLDGAFKNVSRLTFIFWKVLRHLLVFLARSDVATELCQVF